MRSILIALSILLATTVASAQTDNKALAEQLFNQGRELAAKGDWAAACPKFEASLRYDAALGTKLNLANCYEKVGKLASAWGLYRDAAELAAKAGDTKRKDYALGQAGALEKRLPKLTITVGANAPAGLTVTRDGVAVDPAAYGSALYVDPGEHVVVASAPGFESFTSNVTSKEGALGGVVIPPLVAKPEAKPEDIMKPEGESPPTDVVETNPGRTRKIIGISVAAGGVVIAGVGLVFGLKASGKFDDAKALCGADLECDSDPDYAEGKQLISDARSQATLSTVLVAVGGAAVVTGVVVWLTAPKGKAAETSAHLTPVVTDRGAALVLGGRF